LTPRNEAALYLGIVDGLVKDRRYGAALAFLDSYAVAQKEREPHYWLLRGNALLGLGRNGEASQAFDRLAGTSLAGEGWNGKGRIAAAQQRWRLAVEDFAKAIGNAPANSDFLNNLAFAHLHLGQTAQSLGYLRQARELDPRSDRIRNNLLIALTLNGDHDGVEAVLAGIATNTERVQVRALVKAAVASGDWTGGRKS
jgi:Flp pilus assembly protein TadD